MCGGVERNITSHPPNMWLEKNYAEITFQLSEFKNYSCSNFIHAWIWHDIQCRFAPISNSLQSPHSVGTKRNIGNFNSH